MSRETSDEVLAAAREAREYALGNLAQLDHRDVRRPAGLVRDDEVREMLIFAEQAYNRRKGRDDPDFWDTQFARDRLERYASETLTRAIANGDVEQIEYLSGRPDYSPDVSGLNTTKKLEDWLCNSENCKLIYLAGLMGRGKTDWSLSMLDTVRWHYQRVREEIAQYGGEPSSVPTPEFAANFQVEPGADVDCRLLDNYDDLLDWGRRGSSDLERWFIFDEASTELTAQSGANAQDVADYFAPFVKKMRKMGINMIVIGHDKGDVHVAIRSLADFVAKPGLKKAAVYAGIQNREPHGHLFDLDKIPETTWAYETDDMATWSWGSAAEDVDFDGFSETDVKQMAARRGARLVEQHGLSEEKAAAALSDDEISISRWMIRQAQQGEYGSVSA